MSHQRSQIPSRRQTVRTANSTSVSVSLWLGRPAEGNTLWALGSWLLVTEQLTGRQGVRIMAVSHNEFLVVCCRALTRHVSAYIQEAIQHRPAKSNYLGLTAVVFTLCVYVRKTNKMHTFLNNLFHIIYPRHISNKKFFIIRRSSVHAAYSISPWILRGVYSLTRYEFRECKSCVSSLQRNGPHKKKKYSGIDLLI